MKEREQFGSRLGFILVSAGCAIGLGNVWKFPYICGMYGGAAFIVMYVIFLALLGLPILICEFSVGRASRKGIGKAFEVLEKKGTNWHRLKWMGIIGSYILMMFYTMVGGWMFYYAYLELSGKLAGLNADGIKETFNNMLGNPGSMMFFAIIAILLAFGVCALGLQNGVERITKVVMSLLLGLIVILAIHSFALPNASVGIKFYLVPNVELVKQSGIGEAVFAAMTHAFFTLSIGMGAMEIFGSYLDKKRSLTGEAISIVLLDTFVALMAGFIIIPACFSYGVNPDSGPSLLFITLPNVFNNMAGGRIWGALFFLFLTFAALSTIIAVFEEIIAVWMDITECKRSKAVTINIFAIIILSIPAILGFNVLSGFQPIGAGSTVMDLEDFLVSYNLLPLGSLVMVLFCTKKNGWGFDNFIKEVDTGEGIKLPLWVRKYMTYILPLVITVVYLKGYYDIFAKQPLPVLIGWMCFAIVLVIVIYLVAFLTGRKKQSKA